VAHKETDAARNRSDAIAIAKYATDRSAPTDPGNWETILFAPV
jgi:hypothetical protein